MYCQSLLFHYHHHITIVMAESEDDVMKMLMSYYLSADAGAANREKADPNSIDSFAFDEKVFVNDLLSKHPLKDLVSSQQKMMRGYSTLPPPPVHSILCILIPHPHSSFYRGEGPG